MVYSVQNCHKKVPRQKMRNMMRHTGGMVCTKRCMMLT
nr:MAG TPA: hypothetical protein [Caudoviricetes sp.]